jgi:hypothetical protein
MTALSRILPIPTMHYQYQTKNEEMVYRQQPKIAPRGKYQNTPNLLFRRNTVKLRYAKESDRVGIPIQLMPYTQPAGILNNLISPQQSALRGINLVYGYKFRPSVVN